MTKTLGILMLCSAVVVALITSIILGQKLETILIVMGLIPWVTFALALTVAVVIDLIRFGRHCYHWLRWQHWLMKYR